MKKLKITFDELVADARFGRYAVRCDSLKYASCITSDGVPVCCYGAVVLCPDVLEGSDAVNL